MFHCHVRLPEDNIKEKLQQKTWGCWIPPWSLYRAYLMKESSARKGGDVARAEFFKNIPVQFHFQFYFETVSHNKNQKKLTWKLKINDDFRKETILLLVHFQVPPPVSSPDAKVGSFKIFFPFRMGWMDRGLWQPLVLQRYFRSSSN